MAGSMMYKKYREQGLCGTCGKVKSEGSRCEKCKRKELAAKQVRYEARKAAGLCPTCGDPAGDTVLCPKCRGKDVGSQRRYYRNKAAGLCRFCGKDAGGESLCSECKTKRKPAARRAYEKRRDAGICSGCSNKVDSDVTRCTDCRKRDNDRQRQQRQELKTEVFAAYGGPVCVGCGCDESAVLEIDHINGGGNEHRREIGQGRLYPWLKQQGFPPGYRVLCPTCNKRAARGLNVPAV